VEAYGRLVAPAVFNTDVIEYLGQAGSIPVRLRQVAVSDCHGEPPNRIAAVPNSPDDIETRVTVLEREVLRLRDQVALTSSEAAAARVLAAGADHDVSEVRAELRAHTQALNALREIQLEQGRTIAGLDQKVAGLDQKVTSLDQKMTEGFAMLGSRMAQITALLAPNAGSARN
jgi:chromosome segregation ATPase